MLISALKLQNLANYVTVFLDGYRGHEEQPEKITNGSEIDQI